MKVHEEVKKGLESATCIFCEIIRGREEAVVVYEDEAFSAFMDRHPINPGHLLVVPKEHFATLLDMSILEVGRLFSLVAKLAHAVVAATHAEGFNIGQNNGRAASQIVPHVHVHIIPRYYRDSSGGWPDRRRVRMEDLRRIGDEIKREIEKRQSPEERGLVERVSET